MAQKSIVETLRENAICAATAYLAPLAGSVLALSLALLIYIALLPFSSEAVQGGGTAVTFILLGFGVSVLAFVPICWVGVTAMVAWLNRKPRTDEVPEPVFHGADHYSTYLSFNFMAGLVFLVIASLIPTHWVDWFIFISETEIGAAVGLLAILVAAMLATFSYRFVRTRIESFYVAKRETAAD